MTDKQIIIDVTQCPYYKEDKICTYLPYKSKCEGDCNWTAYKEMEEKLKAKEQECERLRKPLIKCDDNIIVDCEYSKKDLCSFIHRKKEVINGLQQQLDQLKAENEELKRELIQYEKDVKDLNYFAIKLKQTLTEIKEYLKPYLCRGGVEPQWVEWQMAQREKEKMAKDIFQILQKISKVEE